MGKHLPEGHLSLSMQDALEKIPPLQLSWKNVWAQSPHHHQQTGTFLGASADANPISKCRGSYTNPRTQLELNGGHICTQGLSAFGLPFPLQQVAAPLEAAQEMRELFLSICRAGIFFFHL